MSEATAVRRRAAALAGHTGDDATAFTALSDEDPGVRATALGALDRLGRLDDAMNARTSAGRFALVNSVATRGGITTTP